MFFYIYFKIVIMENEELILAPIETIEDEWDNHIGDCISF
jgi:16S rRNA G527 N7-methylase RsmG